MAMFSSQDKRIFVLRDGSLFLFLFCLMLSTFTVISYSDVWWGIKEFGHPGWDFSETTGVYGSDSADFQLLITMNGNAVNTSSASLLAARNGAMISWLPDSTFEDLRYAPPDSSPSYQLYVCFFLWDTYAIRTMEGHYAKFRFLQYSGNEYLKIEYVYQPDGSRILTDAISIESFTWSGIKAIYR